MLCLLVLLQIARFARNKIALITLMHYTLVLCLDVYVQITLIRRNVAAEVALEANSFMLCLEVSPQGCRCCCFIIAMSTWILDTQVNPVYMVLEAAAVLRAVAAVLAEQLHSLRATLPSFCLSAVELSTEFRLVA